MTAPAEKRGASSTLTPSDYSVEALGESALILVPKDTRTAGVSSQRFVMLGNDSEKWISALKQFGGDAGLVKLKNLAEGIISVDKEQEASGGGTPAGTAASEEDEDDDGLFLSATALAALQQHLSEVKAVSEEQGVELKKADHSLMAEFGEDWQLSQFWTDTETAFCIANEAIEQGGPKGVIALLSCPTVYAAMKKLAQDEPKRVNLERVFLFEIDDRFAKLCGEDKFVHYDYQVPLGFPDHFKGMCEYVAADPPFLADECLTKVAVTLKALSKKGADGHMMLNTGRKMMATARRELGMRPARRAHGMNELANPFAIYTNYEPGQRLEGWETDEEDDEGN